MRTSCSNVSRETSDRLRAYADLLTTWNKRINLVSKASTEFFHERHLEDSIQLEPFLIHGQWADFGSGGGIPAIPLAIVTGRPVHMVEADRRKAVFLRTALRKLALQGTVYSERIEALCPMNVQNITARGLAPLPKLLEYCQKHLAVGGRAILPKGRNYLVEMERAKETWRFECRDSPSSTEPDSRILIVEGIVRAS